MVSGDTNHAILKFKKFLNKQADKRPIAPWFKM